MAVHLDESEKLCCLSTNLQKSIAASVELNHRSEELVFITEPHARNGKVLTLDRASGKIFASVETGKRPRAALRIRGDLEPWSVPAFTDVDMATATVKIQGVDALVCSLYLDINYEVRKELWRNWGTLGCFLDFSLYPPPAERFANEVACDQKRLFPTIGTKLANLCVLYFKN